MRSSVASSSFEYQTLAARRAKAADVRASLVTLPYADGRGIIPADCFRPGRHLNCGYLTNLDLAVAKGELGKPFVSDPLVEVLAERGAAMAISRMPSGSQSHSEATQIIRKSVIDIVLRKTPNGSDRADSLYGIQGYREIPCKVPNGPSVSVRSRCRGIRATKRRPFSPASIAGPTLNQQPRPIARSRSRRLPDYR